MTERTRQCCCWFCLAATLLLSLVFARLPLMAHQDAGVAYPVIAPAPKLKE